MRTMLGSSLLAFAVCLASAVPQGLAVTVTFDAGAGRPEAYAEAGITVVPAANPEDHVHLGDNDGDGSPDLMLHPLCCATPYQFTFDGGRFTPARLDFVLRGGRHTFTSSSGASVTPAASGALVFPADGWRGITSFTWRNDGLSVIDDQGVVDDLRFCPGDCDDADPCTTDGCDPDDPRAGPDGCTHVANDGPCDDGVFCNGPDRCRAGTCSAHAGDPCQGGPECAGTCDEAAGHCFAAAGTPCDEDGDACTADLCRSGTCAHERLVEASDCTLVQDVLRQALSLEIQVRGLRTLVGDDGPPELAEALAQIHDDLTAAARALGGKPNGSLGVFESPLRRRVRLALAAVQRTRPRIAAFLGALSRPPARARLDAELATEIERRARVVGQGVRALRAQLRKLLRVFASFARSRRGGDAR
jgi:hypothetical protein